MRPRQILLNYINQYNFLCKKDRIIHHSFENTSLMYEKFNLYIDFKLGLDFPTDRRVKLWKAQRHVYKWQLLYLIKGLFSDENFSTCLTDAFLNAISSELTIEERIQYFDIHSVLK